MDQIKKVRKTGFTIAPEAGSQRLRDVINKNITQDDIVRTVTDAFAMGWQVIKLYFMIGLPTETEEDRDELVALVKSLRNIRGPKGRKGKINVSVATFIPKSHTPFQWSAQLDLETSQEIIAGLKQQLKLPGIHFKWQQPEVSYLEGLWARGDRRLSHLLVKAFEKGCRFDGWSDKFRFDLWQEAMAETGISPDNSTHPARTVDMHLPWDHINTGVSRAFLMEEFDRAIKGGATKDCRLGTCHQCGVCDFKTIAPQVMKNPQLSGQNPLKKPKKHSNIFIDLQVNYTKLGSARYLGHLEMVQIFMRSIKRAGIEVKYSQGFHPKPKLSFGNPLPVGIESESERFFITVEENTSARTFIETVNPFLPQGLSITHCKPAPSKKQRHANTKPLIYHILATDSVFSKDLLKGFHDASVWPYAKKSGKGKIRQLDLKKLVTDLTFTANGALHMTLTQTEGQSVRPTDVIASVFNLNEDDIMQLKVVKKAS